MQATDRIKDRIKLQAIQAIPTLASMREITHPYQRPVTNTHTHTLFSRLFSPITGTMTPTPQYLDQKRAHLIKKERCFNYKEKGHITYDSSRKEKIAAISESIREDSDSQEKE